jgi:hypothetical protein
MYLAFFLNVFYMLCILIFIYIIGQYFFRCFMKYVYLRDRCRTCMCRCCRTKPPDGRRQATRELGGPETLSVGPAARMRPEVGVPLGMPPDLYLIRKVFDVL